jgi:AI-2 transport protein TqsA
MGLDAAHFAARLLSTAPQRPQLVTVLRSFARHPAVLLVSAVFGFVVAVIDTLVLWPVGIPLSLLWEMLSFITNSIPNVGLIVGLTPPALLGLLHGGPDLMLAVIIFYSIINFVIQSIIRPKFVGDDVGLSTTLASLSLRPDRRAHRHATDFATCPRRGAHQ